MREFQAMTTEARNAILILYRQIEFRPQARSQPFVHTLSDAEVEDAVGSFRQFPLLVKELTHGLVKIEFEIVSAERKLTTLTQMGPEQYWPSPDDSRPELDTLAPAGRYDAVFLLWPQSDLVTGRSIPSGGWGLAIAAHARSNWATYATVANARSATWQVPKIGEVWLHEWLHDVCRRRRRRRPARVQSITGLRLDRLLSRPHDRQCVGTRPPGWDPARSM